MGKYFGTDGIRGKANEGLNIDIALKVGQYLGHTHQGGKLIIGQDTRLSSSMFASALAAGATSMGADVYLLGVCATPALAYVLKNDGFNGGVMISASHNPYYDNGLKCFASTGMKISHDLEAEIEDFIEGRVSLELAHSNTIGRVIRYEEGLSSYIHYLESLIDVRFEGLNVVLDAANGSAVSSAERLFKDLGASVSVINNTPDGLNINTKCGSTHPETLQETVVKNSADMGFAFDGDADRCLAVNGRGELVDGDEILYIIGKFLNERNDLKDETLVSTVMANLGFLKSCERVGLNVVTTQVGDKYVYSEMYEKDYKLGGEQSGHIILKDYATTGDGVLTALVLAEIAVKSKLSLEELGSGCERYPQLLVNVPVQDKHAIMDHETVKAMEQTIQEALGDDGRLLVRPSGTEPLVRVMVEAQTDDLCERFVNDMIKVIKNID